MRQYSENEHATDKIMTLYIALNALTIGTKKTNARMRASVL